MMLEELHEEMEEPAFYYLIWSQLFLLSFINNNVNDFDFVD